MSEESELIKVAKIQGKFGVFNGILASFTLIIACLLPIYLNNPKSIPDNPKSIPKSIPDKLDTGDDKLLTAYENLHSTWLTAYENLHSTWLTAYENLHCYHKSVLSILWIALVFIYYLLIKAIKLLENFISNESEAMREVKAQIKAKTKEEMKYIKTLKEALIKAKVGDLEKLSGFEALVGEDLEKLGILGEILSGENSKYNENMKPITILLDNRGDGIYDTINKLYSIRDWLFLIILFLAYAPCNFLPQPYYSIIYTLIAILMVYVYKKF